MMSTSVELRADGTRWVFHRTDGGSEAWDHPEGEPRPDRPCTCVKPLRPKPKGMRT